LFLNVLLGIKTKQAKTIMSKICSIILVLVVLAAIAVAEPSVVCTEAAAIVTSGGKITLSSMEMATIARIVQSTGSPISLMRFPNMLI